MTVGRTRRSQPTRHEVVRMTSSKPARPILEFHPPTAERWRDLVTLFDHHGNPGYCWCMTWRSTSTAYRQLASAGRRHALESLVKTGTPTGILGYLNGQPVGWCSIAPRETYLRLERSTTLKRIDDLPTWSVVCFFVSRKARGQGLALKLLQAAVAYAVAQGAKVIEGYPVDSNKSYRFMGSPAIFKAAGFQDAAVVENGRRIVRFVVDTG